MVPTVTFEFAWPGADPAHYALAVDSTGRAAYRDDDPAADSQTGDPYLYKFVVSEPTRSRIFQLAQQAHYFQGDFDYKKGRIAQTGIKTLSYREGPGELFFQPTNGVRTQTSYNWSENPAIQQLTTLFQDIAATLQAGRKLNFLRRFDKLGLEAELKHIEESQKSGSMAELQAIAPALQEVAQDPGVMHVSRQRAQHLLSAVQTASAQPSSR